MRMIAALVCLLPLLAMGQDSRWRIVVERDSMAIGPLSDVRKWAGLRLAANEMARKCAWEVVNLERQVGLLRATVEAQDRALDKKDEAILAMRENADVLGAAASKWRKKAKRRNPVVMVALGVVCGVVLTTAVQ